MSLDCDVLIAGAGVGGAALALALAHRFALRVVLCDRRAGPGNINRGDSLLPAVTQHLAAWGALPALRAAGARPVERMEVHHHRRGLLFEAPLATPGGAPYLVLPHPEIERCLVDTARATGRVEVHYRCRLSTLVEERGRVTGARIVPEGATREAGGDAVRARLVVGADGASSTVRESLGIALDCAPYRHAYFILDVDRPPAYRDAMRVQLHPAGGVLLVPQGEDRVGLGVLVQPAQADLFRAGRLDEKLAEIARRAPILVGRTAFPRGSHLYALSRGHARTYHARGAALLGDAVHVTNPTVGQGMTMAVEDAAALARHVGPPLVAGARSLDAALEAYQAERHPLNHALIRWSHWLSLIYALPSPAADVARRSLFRLGGSPLGRRVHQFLWSRMATRRPS
jgi:2-polyprenyl-6-methoxyphenol hydroxylase-like FAD-dependent oxidoreductase